MDTDYQVSTLKKNPLEFDRFIQNETDKNILKVLKRLGHLGDSDLLDPLKKLLESGNPKIRSLALKNLAKLNRMDLVSKYLDIISKDNSSEVRREAASAIGRLRSKDNIECLLSLLKHKDPDIILQAIRGLLHFKSNYRVKKTLIELKNHKNEIIREVVLKEFSTSRTTSDHKDVVESPDFMKNCILQGDTLEAMSYFPDESIHLTFTSPPYYNARDYSIYHSYNDYLEFLESVFKEVHRVTKEGRFFILNTSPIIMKRVSRQHSSKRYPIPYDIHPLLINMGWEFIDDIIWVKPAYSSKNRVAGFEQHRKPLGYKPNPCTECVMVYRKKTNRLLDWNIRSYPHNTIEKSKVLGEYDKTNVWNIDPCFDKSHSAVFPIQLCNRIIKYYSYVGDLVFDPFGGSGTFAKSAYYLDRFFITTEISEEYAKVMWKSFQNLDILPNKPPKFVIVKDIKSKGEFSNAT